MDSPTLLGKWPHERKVCLAIFLIEARPNNYSWDDFWKYLIGANILNFHPRKRFLLLIFGVIKNQTNAY